MCCFILVENKLTNAAAMRIISSLMENIKIWYIKMRRDIA
jgi:hypothetical protein